MFKLLSVTSRTLCKEDFLARVGAICAAGIDGIILREKDLSEVSYQSLAINVLQICREKGTPCALHTYVTAAKSLHAEALHLPLHAFLALGEKEKRVFPTIGVSCHSLDDVVAAQEGGCSYVTLGHIFATDCKKGLPGRGLAFLSEVCRHASVPVYAIGGINRDNIARVRDAGASGACIMSGLMICRDPAEYLEELRHAL